MPPATARSTGSQSNLPPSVEEAYYRKCIELRRRITEIEDHNDASRLRIKRLNRSVMKMRLERAFLLEQLANKMDHNVDESDRSTSPPPTPQEKPLRSKRSHRKTTPTAQDKSGATATAPSSPPAPATGQQNSAQPSRTGNASPHSTPDPGQSAVVDTPAADRSGSPAVVNGTPARSSHPISRNITIIENVSEDTPAQENGTTENHIDSASAPAEAPGTDAEISANGESRVEGDTEMVDAPSGSDGAFTAVNQ